MQTGKKIAIVGIILLIFVVLNNCIFQINNNKAHDYSQSLYSSSEQYNDDLNSIFTKKLGDYDTFTYFPQI